MSAKYEVLRNTSVNGKGYETGEVIELSEHLPSHKIQRLLQLGHVKELKQEPRKAPKAKKAATIPSVPAVDEVDD